MPVPKEGIPNSVKSLSYEEALLGYAKGKLAICQLIIVIQDLASENPGMQHGCRNSHI